MSKKLRLSLLVSALAVMMTVVPAMAAPPAGVHIEVTATIAQNPDPFTASGPAVEDGIICPAGESTDLSVVVTGPPAGAFRILRVLKRFACADDSGTFDVRLLVHLDLTTNATTAGWQIVGGTGAYAGLHGQGKLVGHPIVPGVSITDIYDGQVH